MIGRVHVVESDVLISKNSNYLLGQMHSAFSHNVNICFHLLHITKMMQQLLVLRFSPNE